MTPTVKTAAEAIEHRALWLEDILAGLLINGVKREEIQIQYFNTDCRTVVVVRGQPQYEWKLEISPSFKKV